jgi:hypothetical protein
MNPTFTPQRKERVYPLFERFADFAKQCDLQSSRHVTFRMWTRGDGSRYKNPNYVQFSSTEKASDVLSSITGKNLLVKGEFGSSLFSPAKKSAGFVFINRGTVIEVATVSILRNTCVWTTQQL